MVASGWVMPAKKSSFVTLKLIYQIRRHELWIPRSNEITGAALCARPPPCNQLIQFIRKSVEKKIQSFNHTILQDAEAKARAKLNLCEAIEKV